MELFLFGTIFAAILLCNNKSVKGVGAVRGTAYVLTRTTTDDPIDNKPVICLNGQDAMYQIDIWAKSATEDGYKRVNPKNYYISVFRNKEGKEIRLTAKKAVVFGGQSPSNLLSLPRIPKLNTPMTGVYGIGELPQEVIDYVESYLLERDFTEHDISRAWVKMDRMRCPLSHADRNLNDAIEYAIDDFKSEYPEFDMEDIDTEDVFMEITL